MVQLDEVVPSLMADADFYECHVNSKAQLLHLMREYSQAEMKMLEDFIALLRDQHFACKIGMFKGVFLVYTNAISAPNTRLLEALHDR